MSNLLKGTYLVFIDIRFDSWQTNSISIASLWNVSACLHFYSMFLFYSQGVLDQGFRFQFKCIWYVSKLMEIKERNPLLTDLGFGFVCRTWLWQSRIHHIQRKCASKMLSFYHCSKSTQGGSVNYSFWEKAMIRIRIKIRLHHKLNLRQGLCLILNVPKF